MIDIILTDLHTAHKVDCIWFLDTLLMSIHVMLTDLHMYHVVLQECCKKLMVGRSAAV